MSNQFFYCHSFEEISEIMSSSRKNTNPFDVLFAVLVGIPLAILVIIVCSPVLLYLSVIEGPIHSFRKKRFFKRNVTKTFLCITPSKKYGFIDLQFRTDLESFGIASIVTFDPTTSTNKLDNFRWDKYVNHNMKFPQLVRIHKDYLTSVSLHEEFYAFFRKEIDQSSLMSAIKSKQALV